MTAVLILGAGCVGFALGWFARRRRLSLLAENNHWVGEEIEALKGADLAADVAEHRRRHSGEHPPVDDPEEMPRHLWPAQFVGLVTPGPGPIPMTGERDTDAQDRELAEVYGLDDPPAANGMHVSRGWDTDRFAPACGCLLAHCGLVIPQTGCVQHDNGKTFRQAHRVEDCPVYADPTEHLGQACGWWDGTTECGDPAEGWTRWADGEPVWLCGVHLAWGREQAEDDGSEVRSLPKGKWT